MKNIFIALLMLLLCKPLLGQYQGDLWIKSSPSGLFDYYAQYVQISGEYIFRGAQSIELEGGFAFGEKTLKFYLIKELKVIEIFL